MSRIVRRVLELYDQKRANPEERRERLEIWLEAEREARAELAAQDPQAPSPNPSPPAGSPSTEDR